MIEGGCDCTAIVYKQTVVTFSFLVDLHRTGVVLPAHSSSYNAERPLQSKIGSMSQEVLLTANSAASVA